MAIYAVVAERRLAIQYQGFHSARSYITAFPCRATQKLIDRN